jgi:hypothetical protein
MTIKEFTILLRESLDTEYSEVIAEYLMEKGYIPKTPLMLAVRGTEEEREMLKQAREMEVSKDLLNYIDTKMKNDFQYRAYKRLVG